MPYTSSSTDDVGIFCIETLQAISICIMHIDADQPHCVTLVSRCVWRMPVKQLLDSCACLRPAPVAAWAASLSA